MSSGLILGFFGFFGSLWVSVGSFGFLTVYIFPCSLDLLLCSIRGVFTSNGGLLSAFMLLGQLFKVAPCGLVQDLAGTVSFSLCQTAHDLKNLVEI